MANTSWDSADRWYDTLVGEKGHYYHDSVIIPSALRMLGINAKAQGALFDVGCGNGVLARHLPKGVAYTGLDASSKLIEAGVQKSPHARFFVADATDEFPFSERAFQWACFLLSLQNMRNGDRAVKLAAGRLQAGGLMLLVLNHPAFRIPRQSSWGVDEHTGLQQRRINRYYSPLEIPIQVHPGKGGSSETTISFHQPLSTYATWLREANCAIVSMEEWRSDKKSEGKNARREDFAREEFPLFLTILARKEA